MRVLFGSLAAAAALTLSVAPAIAKEKEAVKIEKAESFKGLSQVVIGQFSVVYLTKKVDYDGGGFLSASSKGKAIGHLSGLSNEDFQATTDAIYDDFLKQLATHGVTVADDSAFKANKYYAKLKPEAQANKVDILQKKEDHADGLAFWPQQLGRNNNMMLNLRMMDSNMANTYTAEYDYARNAKVPVLNVVYYVDFAKPAKSEGGGLFQNIDVAAGLAVSHFGTQVQLMDTTGKVAKLILQTPLEEGGDFATIKETTSGLTKAGQVVGVLASGIFGGKAGGMSARFDYQVVDTAAYREKAVSAANKTSDLFLRQIDTIR
ncbi:MAG: hypothetical protein WA793_08975 [Sphingorhabdus sp.]|uniref:hypothetical protein n=1 Tax=Sphingorhabdus sp. TaxID=1902408 RepID=UPI003CA237C3